MGQFEPLVIAREGAHYSVKQGDALLFTMPAPLLETYECDALFPPLWTSKLEEAGKKGPRYLLWHPESGELLMGRVERRPPLLAEVYGNHPFRSYLQAFWLQDRNRLVVRIYWNPSTPGSPFDMAARKENYAAARRFMLLISKLMPPQKMVVTLNAVHRYQRIAGLDGTGLEEEPGTLHTVYLSPPKALSEEATGKAMDLMLVNLAGRAYVTMDATTLRWVEATSPEDIEAVKTVLDSLGILYEDTAFKPH